MAELWRKQILKLSKNAQKRTKWRITWQLKELAECIQVQSCSIFDALSCECGPVLIGPCAEALNRKFDPKDH